MSAPIRMLKSYCEGTYKSTLDVRVVDEAGRVLWVDSLILYLDSEQWADTEAVIPFLQAAIRESVHTWRAQSDK